MPQTIHGWDEFEVDSVQFQQRLGILLADMELFVNQLQWATDQMLHEAPAIDNRKCKMVYAEEKMDSPTLRSLGGQLLESTGSAQPHIPSLSYGRRSTEQGHFSYCNTSSSSSAGELSQTDSDPDLMAGSKDEEVSTNQQVVTASHPVYRQPLKGIRRGRSLPLIIEIFKVPTIEDMPRTPSSRLLANIWGTGTRDALPRKQAEATSLELSINAKLTKLLGRRKVSASKFSTQGSAPFG
eukprot:TRINITY_DN77099_c0_g1_i1.p1 TRINITY_DN77099_c0_g1~~TRINITY_DN77099_c0_g1_i1.p1  ORF type:complete len:239 (+),score=37.04 TRINITY_DN77099_c0_g1_i1:45-761(+)